ncbi:MAG: DUF2155 domain-containing protein [Holosporales bacterium]|jgi:hypothetical protein|nr:DUF2155 domain-containing protein [Holosporales bacterium]
MLRKSCYLCLFALLVEFVQIVQADSERCFETVKYIQVEHATLLILDRISSHARKVNLDVGSPKIFGRLKIVLKKAFKNSPEFPPESVVFLEVFDKIPKQNCTKAVEYEERSEMPVFSGWIYASLPSANVFEHPMYNIKVIECF